jgi:Zn-dependent membrane protease YugP
MMFGFSPIEIAIGVFSLLLSAGASLLVKMQFARGQRIAIASGLTGREIAERVLRDADIRDVQIVEHQGFLSDHYNPMNKTLNLSPEVYNGTSAASAGVAAHEVGHAIQHARNYGPMWLRSLLVPPANIGSSLAPWIIMAGFMLGGAATAVHHGSPFGHTLILIGVVLFGAATAFTLVTVPVEFNASARAKERLVALGITQPGPEDNAVRGVLTAAGLTYVAAAVTSVLYLLYYLYQAGMIGGGRRDD